jgi:hypothetical protein
LLWKNLAAAWPDNEFIVRIVIHPSKRLQIFPANLA